MIDDEKIKLRAHEIWESEGRPHGRDREHWERAARDVAAEEKLKDERDAVMTADAGVGRPVEEMYRDKRDSPGATGETIPAPRAKPKRKPRGG